MFTSGQVVKTAGMDMNCNPIEVKATFVRYLDIASKFTNNDGHEFIQDCVVRTTDGIKIIVDSRRLHA